MQYCCLPLPASESVPASGEVTGLGDTALAPTGAAPSTGGLAGAIGAVASAAGAVFCGCEDFLTKGVCSFPFFEKLEQAVRKNREKRCFLLVRKLHNCDIP